MRRQSNQSRLCVSGVLFTWLLATYFACALNIPFVTKLYHVLHTVNSTSPGFIASIPLLFIALFNLLFTPFSFKYLEKGLFITLLLSAAIVNYASYQYGVIFDINMIVNVLQTSPAETASYLSPALFIWVIGLGVIPSLLVYKIRIIHPRWPRDIAYKLLSLLLSILIIAGIGALYYKDYAYIGRENNYLNKLIIPNFYTYSLYKYIHQRYFARPKPYQTIALDATQTRKNSKNTLLILVVGETARAMNYESNGYARPTNQHTRDLGVVSYQNVTSCGTATAISVPCMFTRTLRQDFSRGNADNQDNLVDILKRAGLGVMWLDNDGGCKNMCRSAENITIDTSKRPWCNGSVCVDEVLLENLQSKIDTLRGKNSVLVLHIMGSHGPTYYQRYPQQHQYFKPDCVRSDIQNCSKQTLINSYDNTILYTDFIISRLIKLLQTNTREWDTALIYLSDHGESLGENGLFLHGIPYAVAPPQQTHVPLMTWFSPTFIQQKNIDMRCVQQAAQHNAYSHDNLFDSMLGLLDINTKDYRKEWDMFAPCRGN